MKTMKRLCAALAVIAVVAGSAPAVMAAKIAVIGGKTDDEFFNRIKKGLDDARAVVKRNGGSVTYLQLQSYNNLGPDAAQLVRTAMSQGVDGIVVPDWVPAAEDDAIEAAIHSGISVMLMNAGGIKEARKLGAINYVGSDEYKAGLAGGEYIAKHGKKHVICVNTVPGAANHEARCKGVIDGVTHEGGTAKELPLPATSFGDPTAVAEAIKATLLQDNSIDGVIVLAATDADSAASGIAQANKTHSVALGAFDLNQSSLNRIKDGTQEFAIDQQPYLQSLLSVTLLASHIDFGTKLPTAPILTGPAIVDASNVKATIAGVAKGAR